MLLALVDANSGQSLAAQSVVREHTLYSQHHGLLGVLAHQVIVTDLLEARLPSRSDDGRTSSPASCR